MPGLIMRWMRAWLPLGGVVAPLLLLLLWPRQRWRLLVLLLLGPRVAGCC